MTIFYITKTDESLCIASKSGVEINCKFINRCKCWWRSWKCVNIRDRILGASGFWRQIMSDWFEQAKFFRLLWCQCSINGSFNCCTVGKQTKNFNHNHKVTFDFVECKRLFELDCRVDHFFNRWFEYWKRFERKWTRVRSSLPAIKSVPRTVSLCRTTTKYHQNCSPSCLFVFCDMRKRNLLRVTLPSVTEPKNRN